ncbi:hypothetical protein MAP00_004261 [Monascus purpureus]|nr:hypothetical protein MAP00_004261 [Monascus purpureus]
MAPTSELQHHHGVLDEIFHRKHTHDEPRGQSEGADKAALKKESNLEKFEDHIKKDKSKWKDYLATEEELNEEGKTYGGLM